MQAFAAVAAELKDFLQVFQADKPLVPMLYEYLKEMFQKLMKKVINQKVMPDNKSLIDMMAIDVTDSKNQVKAKDIDINFATKDALRNAKVEPG